MGLSRDAVRLSRDRACSFVPQPSSHPRRVLEPAHRIDRSATCETGRRASTGGNTMADFKTLIDGLSFTECPRWRDGRLYLSDFYTHRVLAVAMDGSFETIAQNPNQPSGLALIRGV